MLWTTHYASTTHNGHEGEEEEDEVMYKRE